MTSPERKLLDAIFAKSPERHTFVSNWNDLHAAWEDDKCIICEKIYDSENHIPPDMLDDWASVQEHNN